MGSTSRVSVGRMKQVVDCASRFGVDGAAKKLGLSLETVTRYRRRLGELMKKKTCSRRRKGDGPNILLFDIETTPILAWCWRAAKAYIQPEMIVRDTRVLCWAAKWFGEDAVMFERSAGDAEDDNSLVRHLSELFSQADIVVAHNGKAFDLSTVWARMAYHGIPPPDPFMVVDTYREAKYAFAFPHNSLAGLARYLNIGAKVEHEGFMLWVKCMNGDKDAWRRMELYNISDVLLLEEVYLRIRPYVKRHPNVALLYEDGDIRCVRCGAAALEDCAKPVYTAVSEFPLYRCRACGAVCRGASRIKRESVPRQVLW